MRTSTIVLPLLVFLVAGGLYLNTLPNGFVFDDEPGMESVRKAVETGALAERLTQTRRPLLDGSLLLNRALGGEEPWGYHLFNLLVHAAAGVVLYDFLRRTLRLPRWEGRFTERDAALLAFAAALLWVAHPIQTQAVAYMVQRCESMMALFFLLALDALVRRATAERKLGWSVLAVLATLASMLCKEVGVMIPFVALAYDRVFLAGRGDEPMRRRLPLYAAMLAGALVYLPLGVGDVADGESAGFGHVPVLDYWLTQAQVYVLVYLRKIVWPHPLVLDYGWPLSGDAARLWPWALLVIAALIASCWGVWKRRWWGFAGLAGFLILAPTTLIPIADAAMEHRVYLPLAAVVVLVAAGLRKITGSATRAAACAAILALPLGTATVARNADYRDGLTLWPTVLAARPLNPRAHNNLGQALQQAGRLEASLEEYTTATHLAPTAALYHANRGSALAALGRESEAEEALRRALSLDERDVGANRNLAVLLHKTGREAESLAYRRRVAALRPDEAASHRDLALSLQFLGQMREAAEEYRVALKLKDDDPETLNNFAWLLATEPAVSDPAEAVRLAARAAEIRRDDPAILDTLARAQIAAGDYAAARITSARALELARAAGDAALVEQLERTLREAP